MAKKPRNSSSNGSNSRSLPPIDILRDIEQRCRANARPLPQRRQIRDTWTAIGFRIRDSYFVAPLKQVSEILQLPRLTPVPGTQPWMKGVANVRGTLLPVMDLQDYLGQGNVQARKNTRVMVLRQDDLAVGLVVDEVLGLRYFRDEEQILEKAGLSDNVRRYVSGSYRQQNRVWHVFSLGSLAQAPEFYKVAV